MPTMKTNKKTSEPSIRNFPNGPVGREYIGLTMYSTTAKSKGVIRTVNDAFCGMEGCGCMEQLFIRWADGRGTKCCAKSVSPFRNGLRIGTPASWKHVRALRKQDEDRVRKGLTSSSGLA
jgi:hypothetical protein